MQPFKKQIHPDDDGVRTGDSQRLKRLAGSASDLEHAGLGRELRRERPDHRLERKIARREPEVPVFDIEERREMAGIIAA